jgi:hypothetical protein
MRKRIALSFFRAWALAAVAFLAMWGCTTSDSPAPGGEGNLIYVTDTFSGKVFSYDADTRTASGSILSINQGGGDWIGFYKGIGYVCIGATGFNSPGVYRFDPSETVPVATRVGSAVSAGAIAFYDDTKAYVIDRNKDFVSGDITSSGVYTFDPSNPSLGLTGPIAGTDATGAGGQYLLGIALGTNGLLYVSDGDNGEVLEIDPAADTLTGRSWNTSASGTTGMLPLKNGNDHLLFVANPGSFASGDGTIDVIDLATGAITGSVVTGIDPTELVRHAGTNSFFASGYTNIHTFVAAGTPPYAAVEVKDGGGNSLGGHLCLSGDLLFVTTTDYFSYSRLAVFDASTATETAYSPVNIGTQGSDAITGIALYE